MSFKYIVNIFKGSTSQAKIIILGAFKGPFSAIARTQQKYEGKNRGRLSIFLYGGTKENPNKLRPLLL